MSSYDPNTLWNMYPHRLMAEGVHYRDMLDLQTRVKTFDQWSPTWSEFADAARKRGENAINAGFKLTAGAELSRASLYYFFAQFVNWHNPSAKREIYIRCAETFARAGEYLDPPQQRVEIPYQGTTMPGYLRLPRGVKKPSLVVLLGGLDTTKEEQLVISDLCIQRGLATLAFDGPGQGETFYKIKMSSEFEKALFAVFDFAEGLSEINRDRLGIIGRSMGGYYGPRIAALDKRVKAAVAWGAMFKLDIDKLPDLTLDGLIYVSGSRDRQSVRGFVESINLSDVADKITCPLMIVHGGLDQITPTENMTMMKDRAKGPVEIVYWPDSAHCGHDRSHICRPAMADFMQKHLAG